MPVRTPTPYPAFIVNQGHPLAQGLVAVVLPNEAGQMVEVLNNTLIPLVGTASVIGTNAGFALNSPSGQNGANVAMPSNEMWQSKGAAILWRGCFSSTPSGGAAVLFGVYSPSQTGCYIGIMTGQSGPSTNIGGQTNRGSQYAEFNSVVGINTTFRDVIYTVGAIDTSAQPGTLYENGLRLGGGTVTYTTPVSGDTNFVVGYLPGFARNTFGEMAHGMIWNRGLSPSETQWLTYEPFSMLQRTRRIKYSFSSGGVGGVKFRRSLGQYGTGAGKRQRIGV